ncbi:MAG: M3 family metallopeptidase [Opitutus sp.]
MTLPRLSLITLLSVLTVPAYCAGLASFADYQKIATDHRVALTLPVYPRTTDEIRSTTASVLQTADAALAKLAALSPKSLTFANTIIDLDEITGNVSNFAGQMQTIAETSTDAKMREVAREMGVKMESWAIALEYRDDLYRVVKAYADTAPKLDAQQQRLLDFTMRSYRRAGLALPEAERKTIEQLRKDLSALEQQFAVNINEARAPLDFTAEELAGLPPSVLQSPGVLQPDGKYRVLANVTWQAIAVFDNATRAETRYRVYVARNSLAKDTNLPVLAKLVALRADIAQRLGYANWADYRTETRMAKTGATAVKFEEDLVKGLQPKYDAEMEELRQLKVKETGDRDAKLGPYDADIRYYTNQLKKQRYAVDAEQLRVYFPYQATLEGMFRIYQSIFRLKFTEVTPPYVWSPGVQLFVVTDSATGVPIGSFYLDMFPREGKFNHFACFPQMSGRVLANGVYELPVNALVCNFPPPVADKPSLLAHNDVETLFHEFGHVMHGLLSRARFVGQTSSAVPRDFIEAPSQMLENWVWDKAVLDTFAADYRDPSKKIPGETIAALTEARRATDGMFNRRQLMLGLVDLTLHTHSAADAAKVDIVKETNSVIARVIVAPDPQTAFVTYFGHLAGYDAGYYGYLWSKVLAIDMASEFRKAPKGFLDVTVGRRLRDEVYAAGDTRDVGASVEKFLGRPTSMKPFLEYVGINK